MANQTQSHRVEITSDGKVVGAWTEYEFSSSMVQPADSWEMGRVFTKEAWKTLSCDSEIHLTIDGTVMMNGFVDVRDYDSRAGTMKVEGRDRAGRLVQTSIPTTTGYDGLSLTDAVKKLSAPWFTTITLSDARNRTVRRGKGGKAPAGGEPAIFNVRGRFDEDHSGRVEPGEMCWNMIEQLTSSVSLLAWSSADGRELIIGKPNYQQEPQYFFRRSKKETNTVINLRFAESVRDRYAMIEAHGSSVGNDQSFGDETVSKIGSAFDGPNPDGTGRDFKRPKRLALTHRALADNAEAGRAAKREMDRRNFSRRQLVIEAPLHGQRYKSQQLTLFAPNTLARVVDDVLEIDDVFLIYECGYRCRRNDGETTQLKLVPRGTVFIS